MNMPVWEPITPKEETNRRCAAPVERVYLQNVISALGYKYIRDVPREKLDRVLEELMRRGLI